MEFSIQRTDEYKMSDQASTISRRDYKSATDLITDGGGGDDMDEIVRRLTPRDCELLQGYPEGWTLIGEPDGYDTWKDERGEEYPVERYVYVTEDGKKKKVTDSERYKALGNSICLPFWFYLLRRISAQYERPATLGSLFDGIGGFPLAWQRCNGEGTALWASEIEPFCIAVTKEHFS